MGQLNTPMNNEAAKQLINTVVSTVLPALAAAHPSADFNWRGNTQAFAQEYARALVGTGCTGADIRTAVDAMRKRSAYERHPPNAQQFMIMCLQARGLPTLDECLKEMEKQRIENFGKQKTWPNAFCYWLNAEVSQLRGQLPHSQWMKFVNQRYVELANIYAKGNLSDIPLKLEHKVEPAYKRYLDGGTA